MPSADKAKMIVELDFVAGKFTAGIKNASASIGRLEGAIKKSHAASTALGIGLYQIGAKAASALTGAITSGISLAAELEDANRATAGALEASGLAAKVSAADIRTWSEAIEEAVAFSFDDKAIQRAANTLISFGGIAETSLQQAMTVATNLAPRFGGVESAAESLAKSLVDPTTATRILKTAGIALTVEQKEQIKTWVAAGEKAKAQAFLLDLLTEKTDGLAKASAGPYRQAMNLLAESVENAKIVLGQAFLPVLMKVGTKLGELIKTDKFMAAVKELGEGLANAFDAAVSFAEKIPWGVVADSLRIAATGAKAVFAAFTSLPPWVQTAVLTGWGLNKLSGGALGGLLGGLSKGLGEIVMEKFKGVLGIQAGVVNVTGGVVNAPGGGLPGGGKGGLPGVVPAAAAGGILAPGLLVAAAMAMAPIVAFQIIPRLIGAKPGFDPTTKTNTNPAKATEAVWSTVGEASKSWGRPVVSAVDSLKQETAAVMGRVNSSITAGDSRTASRIDSLNAAVRAIKIAPVINVSTYPQITIRNVATANRIATAIDVRKGTGGGKIL